MSPLNGSPRACGYMTIQYMNSEHTWAALGWIALANRSNRNIDTRHLQVRIFTVKQDGSHRGHMTKVISIRYYRSWDWHVQAGNRTRASAVDGECSSKEVLEQRALRAIWNIYISIHEPTTVSLPGAEDWRMCVCWLTTTGKQAGWLL